MLKLQMGAFESRFADIIWENEPITAAQLARFGQAELNWKKTTSYTVLKRLCDKGIFQNDNGTVTSCLSRDEFRARQSENFVKNTFGGSLPAFLAAFTSRQALSQEDVTELRRMVAEFEGK